MNEPTTVTRQEQLIRIAELRGNGVCRSCLAPVQWGITLDGRPMPLENELRVKALLSRELKQRITIRVATKPGTTTHERCKNESHEQKLVAQGWTVREELVEVWEIPASLTHWPNCKTANEHRRSKR
jgi:hypothetical protein